MSSSSLYPPGFAGINRVHGDVPLDEWSEWEEWFDDVAAALDEAEAQWTEDGYEGDKPPAMSEEALLALDIEADRVELDRLLSMGVVRELAKGEDTAQFSLLTTKMVRDWRKRPMWKRRSRLVAREFKRWSEWSQELFAPSSSLGTIHGLIAWAQTMHLELVTLDIKDAYLNVVQKQPVLITVDPRLFGNHDPAAEPVPYVLEMLLPGQRIAASEWYQFIKGHLETAGMNNYDKEPTLFKGGTKCDPTALVLHADDGLLAASPTGRRKLIDELSKVVTVQVSDPLKDIEDEIEFLKRRYVCSEQGITMYGSRKHVDGLLDILGNVKERDTPTDQSFLEPDNTEELNETQSKQYKECVGRLLYLSHTRPDVQFGVCVLAGKMAKPTKGALRWLQRVAGYLKRVPVLGFKIGPLREGACLGYLGAGPLESGGKTCLESVTDADWAGCKRTRHSKSSIQVYLGGSLLCTIVRSQKNISLSSGESEFVAMVGGATEVSYIADCMNFLLDGFATLDVVLRTDSAAAKGIGQRIGCGRVRHLDCGLLWIQRCIKEKKMRTASIAGTKNPADIGTKPLTSRKLKELLCRAGCVDENGEDYGYEEVEEAENKTMVRAVFESKAKVNAKKALPLLLVMAQILGAEGCSYEGLSLVAGICLAATESFFEAEFSLKAVILAMLGVFMWTVWAAFCSWKEQVLRRTATTSTQTEPSWQLREHNFVQQYVEKARELESLLHEERQLTSACEEELKRLRAAGRASESRRPQLPRRIEIATKRGRSYHLPGCPFMNSSGSTQTYEICNHCDRRGT